ncbi:MAG: precorrin-4 C(11)-methyltransferase [Gammaproteobacteria bacterium]|nr:precorrin-4 C(11)-methyltransferase [Gammaproteobacteria bacterium]
MSVYFVGAGPGDPELLTLKGLRLIKSADVIIYAGSLIPEALLDFAKTDAAIYNSAELDLNQIIQLIEKAYTNQLLIVRLHSGDPSIYGAIGEQIRQLEQKAIPYEIVPGVTAASAAAAILGKEFTLSGVSQSVIFTRYHGKTPMPERERLAALAQHGTTLVIHLSTARIHQVMDDVRPFYGADCPVAVVYRASWPDEKIVLGCVDDIVIKTREQKITRTALIIVGHVLDSKTFLDSFLYQAEKAHIFRPKYAKQKQIN